MTNFHQVNTTAFNLKLKLKNKPTKIIWYINNIQKDQITILSKHPHKKKYSRINHSLQQQYPRDNYYLKKA